MIFPQGLDGDFDRASGSADHADHFSPHLVHRQRGRVEQMLFEDDGEGFHIAFFAGQDAFDDAGENADKGNHYDGCGDIKGGVGHGDMPHQRRRGQRADVKPLHRPRIEARIDHRQDHRDAEDVEHRVGHRCPFARDIGTNGCELGGDGRADIVAEDKGNRHAQRVGGVVGELRAGRNRHHDHRDRGGGTLDDHRKRCPGENRQQRAIADHDDVLDQRRVFLVAEVPEGLFHEIQADE